MGVSEVHVGPGGGQVRRGGVEVPDGRWKMEGVGVLGQDKEEDKEEEIKEEKVDEKTRRRSEQVTVCHPFPNLLIRLSCSSEEKMDVKYPYIVHADTKTHFLYST